MKGLCYANISSNASQVLALTGFKPEEFALLYVHFGKKWQHYMLTQPLASAKFSTSEHNAKLIPSCWSNRQTEPNRRERKGHF